MTASYDNNILTLTLSADTAYPHPIAIKAAKPIFAANSIYKSTPFKKLGSVPSLTHSADITDLYLSRFHVPGPGYKIALELTGVAPGGYHTADMLVIGIVGSAAA